MGSFGLVLAGFEFVCDRNSMEKQFGDSKKAGKRAQVIVLEFWIGFGSFFRVFLAFRAKAPL